MNKSSSEQLALAIRKQTLRLVNKTNLSHIGSCFSCADILAVLYSEILNYRPTEPAWPERDRLIVNKGHAASIVYSVLAEVGYFSKSEFEKFGEAGTQFLGHIEHHVPGVEFSTGSLGHGLSVSSGLALGLKKSSCRIFCLLSDGELNEGSVWEAIHFAGHHQLTNLTMIVDANGLQGLAPVEEVLKLEPLAKKFEAFRWKVIEVNGHNHSALIEVLNSRSNDSPTAVIARTIKGKGVSYMENQIAWHYKSPNAEQLETAIKELEK